MANDSNLSRGGATENLKKAPSQPNGPVMKQHQRLAMGKPVLNNPQGAGMPSKGSKLNSKP